jgi:hypothetical protein
MKKKNILFNLIIFLSALNFLLYFKITILKLLILYKSAELKKKIKKK